MAPTVQMLTQFSGTYDGQDYPGPGGFIELADIDAKQFIEHGWAREPKAETATAPPTGLTTASLDGPPAPPVAPPAAVEPPRAGPGSSADAWRDYAAAIGVTVAADAKAKDVQAAVDAFTAEQAS
ncbi:hypothetical protein QT381_02575 [Galbitalea sp. SE-J8]|uniref:hypothetical protein n=1 Tax=Galbitalea sp. SE-J8 TaxID=3054952 RepID=UPI00259CDB55|nr:hypothetical protein [Galbitalea sp. SE-J8]MDM4761888.1 hypothetical protein [Galbitalea sp. SE-J8]